MVSITCVNVGLIVYTKEIVQFICVSLYRSNVMGSKVSQFDNSIITYYAWQTGRA